MARFETTQLECVDCGAVFEFMYRCPECGSKDVITLDEEETPMNR